MNRNTSITLGGYFDTFVQGRVSEGRYKNVSEVIRAGLRLLDEEENKALALKAAIQEGIESGIAQDFNPEKHLEDLNQADAYFKIPIENCKKDIDPKMEVFRRTADGIGSFSESKNIVEELEFRISGIMN